MIGGFAIGHHTADGAGWLTGTTVVLAEHGAVGGVDVRGGAPGTRETDLLDPRALVEQVDAVALCGGSAYGLAAADGVMSALADDGRGLPVGRGPGEVVPIVPAAVIFDLGRGGVFGHRPTAEFGVRAYQAAKATLGRRTTDPVLGCVGAGTGAVAGGLKGGFGYAEGTLSRGDDGIVGRVGVAIVVNAAGSPVDPESGTLWSDQHGRLDRPDSVGRVALSAERGRAGRPFNTTIGVVLTDQTLTKAQAGKVAAVAHDGLARSVRPAHGMTDGDAFFALASGRQPAPVEQPKAVGLLNRLLEVTADTVVDACFAALTAAETRGPLRAYRELAGLR
ncbi:MAG TPA: P1 family peptidase [Microlunatus sp.]|nr:P1 family peptidase [Microlunatus sp.]